MFDHRSCCPSECGPQNGSFEAAGNIFGRTLRYFAVALLSGSVAIGAAFADDIPGMSDTKPETGPSVEVDGKYMVPYTMMIPGTDIPIEMVPIPGGEFLLGSPEDAEGHQDDEGPQVKVKIDPFWMSKCETTWIQYKKYMSMYNLFKNFQVNSMRRLTDENKSITVTAPTALYDPEITFEYGDDPQQPAVTMTQYAAKQYTKWLSLLAGQQFRLPTEAEWEYACRAGSQSAYSFGDDPAKLEEYAWFFENSEEGPRTVGQKKPNAFGLYDMHGNVAEWTVDEYTEDGYVKLAEKLAAKGGEALPVAEAVQWPTTAYPRVVRGGSWEFEPEDLRSAARLGSDDEDWKAEDPNIPLSPWWFTSDPARGVGFRIVRSYKPLGKDDMKKYWEIDNEDIDLDVEVRLQEGRGVLGVVDEKLAEEIEKASN